MAQYCSYQQILVLSLEKDGRCLDNECHSVGALQLCCVTGVKHTGSQLSPVSITVTPSETHLPQSPTGLSAPLPSFLLPAFSFLHMTPVCGNLATSSLIFLGSQYHSFILCFSSLLGTYIRKHPSPGSWSPTVMGAQKTSREEADLGSGTSTFAKGPCPWLGPG